MEASDIVDTAIADGRFTTLVAALQAAELVDALKAEGPFTVFAPTDDAFAALPEGTLDSLLLPENKQTLTDILLYHVVEGKVMAADVTGLKSATTLLGKDVTVKVDMGNNDIDRMPEIKERSLQYEGLKHYFIIKFPQRSGALRMFVNKVLGENDDITLFEYTKKNSKESWPDREVCGPQARRLARRELVLQHALDWHRTRGDRDRGKDVVHRRDV